MKDIFIIAWNACFSKDISVYWHLVFHQSLALLGFLATSPLTSSCDTRLLSQTFLAIKKMKSGKAVEVLFDFSGQTFWCEICCCKTSQSFRDRMDSWIKWLSLLSTLKIDIVIMAETKTTGKWNRASLFFTCVRVSRQRDCVFIQNYSPLQWKGIIENSNFSPSLSVFRRFTSLFRTVWNLWFIPQAYSCCRNANIGVSNRWLLKVLTWVTFCRRWHMFCLLS